MPDVAEVPLTVSVAAPSCTTPVPDSDCMVAPLMRGNVEGAVGDQAAGRGNIAAGQQLQRARGDGGQAGIGLDGGNAGCRR